MLDPRLVNQSRGRVLTEAEARFAEALEQAFATGKHEPGDVAAALSSAGVANPFGDEAPWTGTSLLEALQRLNASLDQVYADHGIGA